MGARASRILLSSVVGLCVACSGSSHKRAPAPATTSSTGVSAPTTAAVTTVATSATSTSVPPTSVKTTSTVATTTTTRAPRTTVLTQSANGSQVSGIVGDIFKVELSACTASCGYRWVITGLPSPQVLTYLGEQDTPPSTTTTAPSTTVSTTTTAPPTTGGSTTQTFSFKAVGAHGTGLIIGYFPPASATASATYTLTFHISP